MAAPILEVDDLTVAFGATRVLDHLDLRVLRGDSLAVIGPNGSGKTVLFQALVGSLPFEGRIRWAPHTRIGYVPQRLDLERDLPITGLDLLAAKRRVLRSSEDVVAIARKVGLDAELEKRIGLFSGGQFQRLLVALALVGKPDVLLLDELTAGVDVTGQERLPELVRRLQRDEGLTVLAISHDLSIVSRAATHVLCLARAHAWYGAPSEVLTAETLQAAYGTDQGLHVHA